MTEIFQKFIFTAVFVVIAFLSASLDSRAQSTPPQPTNTPDNSREAIERINERNATSRRFEALRNVGTYTNRRSPVAIHLETIRDRYRKPTREEAIILKPGAEDLAEYSAFLRGGNTGMIRLFEELGCAQHSIVVVASEECLKYSMPGGGASYSFRIENYRLWRLADITYSGRKFQSLGVLLQGIIVNIGDVPVEKVSLKTNGVKYLAEFQPEVDFADAKQMDLKFIKGVESGGFAYKRSVLAEENTTFVMRSIAYRGNVYRSFQGITYDELDFDKRKDVIIVFRIIRRDESGATIIWKELDRQDSPKIKMKAADYDRSSDLDR